MSQFILLCKRRIEDDSKYTALQSLPPASILELTDENVSILWPVHLTIIGNVSLDSKDPTDREVLRFGQWISTGGLFYSALDFMKANQIPEDSLYCLHLGSHKDIHAVREMLTTLKYLL